LILNKKLPIIGERAVGFPSYPDQSVGIHTNVIAVYFRCMLFILTGCAVFWRTRRMSQQLKNNTQRSYTQKHMTYQETYYPSQSSSGLGSKKKKLWETSVTE